MVLTRVQPCPQVLVMTFLGSLGARRAERACPPGAESPPGLSEEEGGGVPKPQGGGFFASRTPGRRRLYPSPPRWVVACGLSRPRSPSGPRFGALHLA